MIAKTSAALLVPISSMFVITTAGTDPQLTSQGRGSIPRRNDWVSKFEMEKSSIFAMPMFDMEPSHSEPEVRASSFTMPNAKFSAMRTFDKEWETGQYGFDDRARLFAMPRKFAMENSSCLAMPMFDIEASRSEPEVRVSSFSISNTKIFAMQMSDKEGKNDNLDLMIEPDSLQCQAYRFWPPQLLSVRNQNSLEISNEPWLLRCVFPPIVQVQILTKEFYQVLLEAIIHHQFLRNRDLHFRPWQSLEKMTGLLTTATSATASSQEFQSFADEVFDSKGGEEWTLLDDGQAAVWTMADQCFYSSSTSGEMTNCLRRC